MSRNDITEKSTTLTAVITNIITTATHTVVITTITQNPDYCTIPSHTTHCPITDASSDVGSNIGSNIALATTTAFIFILTAKIARISI